MSFLTIDIREIVELYSLLVQFYTGSTKITIVNFFVLFAIQTIYKDPNTFKVLSEFSDYWLDHY